MAFFEVLIVVIQVLMFDYGNYIHGQCEMRVVCSVSPDKFTCQKSFLGMRQKKLPLSFKVILKDENVNQYLKTAKKRFRKGFLAKR